MTPTTPAFSPMPRFLSGAALTCLFAALLASSARAQAVRIDPFTGEHFEGFETQATAAGGAHPPSHAPCLLGDLFQGRASMCSLGATPLISVAGGAFGNCGVTHRTGDYFAGSLFAGLAVDFTVQPAAFGGHFQTSAVQGSSPAALAWDVEFFDSTGFLLDTDTLLLPACGVTVWLGWQLPSGTRRIEFTPVAPGRSLWMDDLAMSESVPIGTVYCSSNETSTRQRAQCGAAGSDRVADQDLTLRATQLPPSVFGFFLVSRDAGLVPNPGGSEGILCLQGSIGRFAGPGQILGSGPSGSFSLPIDLGAVPQGAATTAVAAGDTWRFQAWFRDVTPGANPLPTSNFTSALAVTFI